MEVTGNVISMEKIGADLESVLEWGVYENLTRSDFSTIRLVKDCYFDARSAQPDQRKSSRVSGPMIFFGPRLLR